MTDSAALSAPEELFPFVALSVQSTGIHPSTARVVSVDVLTFNDAGEVGEEFHAVLNPGSDPGPRHYHGLSPEEIAAGQRFSAVLKTLDRLIDGRTLILHNIPVAWGFIVAEARRAMNAAARANRSRGRGRSSSRRRRHKVGHIPRPVVIVDTLASARRQALPLIDARLNTLAHTLGITEEPATATQARAQLPEEVTSREMSENLIDVYFALEERGELTERSTEELRPDRFGLQRTALRVDAVEAPRPFKNPGVYVPGRPLVKGMEVVISPDITMDPDELIALLVTKELAYSEKLTRTASLVVCNENGELRGKAMHAARKGIPLVRDVDFLAALEGEIAEGQPAAASTA